MTISKPSFEGRENTSLNQVCQRKNFLFSARLIVLSLSRITGSYACASNCLLMVSEISCCNFTFLPWSLQEQYEDSRCDTVFCKRFFSSSKSNISPLSFLYSFSQVSLLKSTPIKLSISELPCIILQSRLGNGDGVSSSTTIESQKRKRAISTAPFSISTPQMLFWIMLFLISARS